MSPRSIGPAGQALDSAGDGTGTDSGGTIQDTTGGGGGGTAPSGGPFYYVISSRERAFLQSGAPTTATIEAGFAGALANQNMALQYAATQQQGLGATASWVSPQARVVRIASGGLSGGDTYATNVVQYSGVTQQQADTLANALTQFLIGTGGLLGNWSQPTATPYSEGLNGPLAWWQCAGRGSDCAAITMTRQDFQPSTSSAPDENPTGPTTGATHPPSFFNPLGGPGGVGGSIVDTVFNVMLLIGLGIAGIIVIPRLFKSSRDDGGSRDRQYAETLHNPRRLRSAR